MRDLRWRAGGLDPCHRFTGNHEFLGESQKMGAAFAPQNAGKFHFGGFQGLFYLGPGGCDMNSSSVLVLLGPERTASRPRRGSCVSSHSDCGGDPVIG